jgi:hypothetical protein
VSGEREERERERERERESTESSFEAITSWCGNLWPCHVTSKKDDLKAIEDFKMETQIFSPCKKIYLIFQKKIL